MIMHYVRSRISVDDVQFGACSQSLIGGGYVENADGYDEITGWRTFQKNDEVEVYVAEGAVVCVTCFQNCSLDGVGLIGMTPSDLLVLLGSPDEIGEVVWVSDELQQVPYEYFALGLQVWFESGKVVSVFCNANY